MEVAGQWRREWAGTAEYGKVTEGGVTRRIARALEVMHASSPGARVRVVRAAYHSTAGPGAPAASCLMHSSRRVITSGFNILESPSLPSKPLEISSTPLDLSPELNTEGENYKVTEPDDFDISEPSKWKSSIGGKSTRMPSEESSSADNASIIDLDPRPSHKNLSRKYSYDSENSEILTPRRNSLRMSPLLDAPVALSTLKYKSLLNGSNDWNNRRKSYSFEDTSPLNETILHSNDTLAMESSTDSGICKSTEIVDDPHDAFHSHKVDNHADNFQSWLSKNRPNTFYKGNQIKKNREHDVVIEHPHENKIALQSKGKVSITVPIKIEVADDYEYKSHVSDDGDRKVKKVEFCKTELHFAAETGKVNIIATDEKPPPTNDYRKRRSAFVPIHKNFEKPITLFGEPRRDFPEVGSIEFPTFTNTDNGDYDENTAATRSILKNKIPKPKPYLLGENMEFGNSDKLQNTNDLNDSKVPTAVTLINSNLQSRGYSDDAISGIALETDPSKIKNNAAWTTNKGPLPNDSFKLKRSIFEAEEHSTSNHVKDTKSNFNDSIKNKIKTQLSPVTARARTRQLRVSDLTYFGIDKEDNDKEPKTKNVTKPIYNKYHEERKSGIEDFHSVRLIQQVSNSVCNSEAESEPDYQNLPIKTNFAPVPIPRQRTRVLDPLIEQDSSTKVSDTRRSRLRTQDETTTSIRSISEPPKRNSIEKPRRHIRRDASPESRSRRHCIIEEKSNTDKENDRPNKSHKDCDESDPLYVNLSNHQEEIRPKRKSEMTGKKSDFQQEIYNKIKSNVTRKENKSETKTYDKYDSTENNIKEKSKRSNVNESPQRNKNSLNKDRHVQRTEKLSTPDYNTERKHHDRVSRSRKTSSEHEQKAATKPKQEHRTRSSHRMVKKNIEDSRVNSIQKNGDNHGSEHDTSHRARKPSKDRTARKDKTKMYQKLDSMNSNAKDTNSTEKISRADNYKTPKRSEIVINYDDKNGTVSSICKVKHDSGTSRRKIKEAITDIPKEQKIKNQTSDKKYLRK